MSWSNVQHFQWKVVSTWLMDSQSTAAIGAFNSSLEHIVRNGIVLGLLFLTVAFMLQHTHKCCNKGCCSSSLWSLHDASRFYPGFYLSSSLTWLYLYHDLFYGGILSPQSCGYCGSHMMLRKKNFCSRIFNKRSYTEHLHMILQTEFFMAHLTLSSQSFCGTHVSVSWPLGCPGILHIEPLNASWSSGEVFPLYGFSSCAWLQVSSSLVLDSRIKNAQQLYKVCVKL